MELLTENFTLVSFLSLEGEDTLNPILRCLFSLNTEQIYVMTLKLEVEALGWLYILFEIYSYEYEFVVHPVYYI